MQRLAQPMQRALQPLFSLGVPAKGQMQAAEPAQRRLQLEAAAAAVLVPQRDGPLEAPRRLRVPANTPARCRRVSSHASGSSAQAQQRTDHPL